MAKSKKKKKKKTGKRSLPGGRQPLQSVKAPSSDLLFSIPADEWNALTYPQRYEIRDVIDDMALTNIECVALLRELLRKFAEENQARSSGPQSPSTSILMSRPGLAQMADRRNKILSSAYQVCFFCDDGVIVVEDSFPGIELESSGLSVNEPELSPSPVFAHFDCYEYWQQRDTLDESE